MTRNIALGWLVLACGVSLACGDDAAPASSSSNGAGGAGGVGALPSGGAEPDNGGAGGAAGGGGFGEGGVGGSEPQGGIPEGYTCPTEGGEMVQLPNGFCIDATEVTRAAYASWLETSPGFDSRPDVCADNTDFTPACAWPPGNNEQLPVACVDWCDAEAYCHDMGKSLCGHMWGGPNAYAHHDDPERSRWFYACSSAGQYDYTYGDEHDPAACRGSDEDQWAWVDVGSLDACQSPDPAFAGVFDLSGNVMEWEDSCESSPDGDRCRVRGGSFNYGGPGLRCDAGEDLGMPRDAYYVGIGFRCCAP